MSTRFLSRLRGSALAVLALVTLVLASPSAFARGHISVGISLPGIGIGYSDHGRHGSSWGGYASSYYPSYGGYYGGGYGGYGYAPRPVYYAPSYRYVPSYRDSYYGRPSRVVYYDRHDRRDDRRYDRRDRRDDDRYDRHDRRNDRQSYSRGGYYDRRN